MYYQNSENKGADQLCIFVFAYAKSRFSHDKAGSHIVYGFYGRFFTGPLLGRDIRFCLTFDKGVFFHNGTRYCLIDKDLFRNHISIIYFVVAAYSIRALRACIVRHPEDKALFCVNFHS